MSEEYRQGFEDARAQFTGSGLDVERLRKAATAMLNKWGDHRGSCCVFDDNGKVIVTDESCKCGPVERELRAALKEQP